MHSRKSRAKLFGGYDGLPVLGLVPASSRVGRPPVLGLGRVRTTRETNTCVRVPGAGRIKRHLEKPPCNSTWWRGVFFKNQKIQSAVLPCVLTRGGVSATSPRLWPAAPLAVTVQGQRDIIRCAA